ncbi:hypothetical protein BGW39_005176 [Mortierella sp. 14UC]|nr:hypothetical protein BGW39_005176 [Mortierella sp. 14UC]
MTAFNNNNQDGIFLFSETTQHQHQHQQYHPHPDATEPDRSVGCIIKQFVYDNANESVDFSHLRPLCLGLASILDLVDRSENSQFMTLFDAEERALLDEKFAGLRRIQLEDGDKGLLQLSDEAVEILDMVLDTASWDGISAATKFALDLLNLSVPSQDQDEDQDRDQGNFSSLHHIVTTTTTRTTTVLEMLVHAFKKMTLFPDMATHPDPAELFGDILPRLWLPLFHSLFRHPHLPHRNTGYKNGSKDTVRLRIKTTETRWFWSNVERRQFFGDDVTYCDRGCARVMVDPQGRHVEENELNDRDWDEYDSEQDEEVGLLVFEGPRNLESEQVCRAGAKVLRDCKDLTNFLVRVLPDHDLHHQYFHNSSNNKETFSSDFLRDTASFGIYIQGLHATIISLHLVAKGLYVAVPEADLQFPTSISDLPVVVPHLFNVLFKLRDILFDKAQKVLDAVPKGVSLQEHLARSLNQDEDGDTERDWATCCSSNSSSSSSGGGGGGKSWINETYYDDFVPDCCAKPAPRKQ